ncbi:tripartite tricarboxylate transporter TctB family protein [Nesterenkonia ebinurensis]|uniref:tripartite tricarboxylate transporter TctB family protein n=1 Tax=Nesterenkonia ebinurensis TaxID=2608252 RepID=UPI00123CCAD4|nr:tripartite tricarboxylate transporter TctB family protein [Nesterenkonia ebinurensis]
MSRTREKTEDVLSQLTDESGSSTEQNDALLTTADYVPERAGTVTNFVCGAVVSLLGIGALLVAWDLGFGSLTQPRAGTWPGILSALLILLGALIMLQAKSFNDAERLTFNAAAVGVGAVSLAVAVQLMPHIGFEIPAVLLTVFWMSVLGKEKYLLSIPLSVAAVAGFYLIFVTGLNVPLPRLF